MNPAVEAKAQNRKGLRAAGMDADLICLDRETLALQWTRAGARLFELESSR